MYLYIKHGGQLGNRLMPILPAYSFCIEHNTTLYVLFAAEKYLDLFPNAKLSKNIKFLFNAPNWPRFQKFLIKLSEKFRLEISEPLENIKSSRMKLQFIDGWQHRNDSSYVQKHKYEILRTFSFKPSVEEDVKKYFKENNTTYIGVHVRRGDYKNWKSGIYYYDNNVYLRIMNELAGQIKNKVKFLISSNEKIELYNPSLEYFQIPNASAETDLCALSKCNYIIGPPSTFSQWASFYGSVPMKFILDKDQSFYLSDFSPIVKQDFFENGEVLFK